MLLVAQPIELVVLIRNEQCRWRNVYAYRSASCARDWYSTCVLCVQCVFAQCYVPIVQSLTQSDWCLLCISHCVRPVAEGQLRNRLGLPLCD